MEIKRVSRDLSKKEVFKLTDGDAYKMSDAAGMVIDIDCWCLYNDLNSKGQEQQVLSIMDNEGHIYGTISQTFIQKFMRMVDFFGDELTEVVVKNGTSKAGREFVTCDIS